MDYIPFRLLIFVVVVVVVVVVLMVFYAIIFWYIDMAGQCQTHVSRCFWRQADLKTTGRVRDDNMWKK